MMKILFLDIDGVLNSKAFYRSDYYRKDPNGLFLARNWVTELDYEAVSLLETLLINDPEIHIVISSTWRILNNIGQIKGYFKEVSSTFPVARFIGETYNSNSGHRGTEIELWIKEYEFDGLYAIIDDDADMLDYQPFVQTTHDLGIQDCHIKELEAIFANRI